MKGTFSYLRFSSGEQAKGDSVRRQLKLSENYAKLHGVKLTEIRDLGVSAFRGDNIKYGALGRFLKLVEAGKIEAGSTLIVESLDRLSRLAPEEALGVFLQIINNGVKIVTLFDNHEYEKGKINQLELLTSIVTICRANEEVVMKSDRLSASWKNKRAKARQGEPTTKLLPSWLKLENNKIVIDEKWTAIIRRIFDLALNGFGTGAIVKTLNKEGIQAKRSKVWNPSTIQKTLHNRAVLGEFQPHIETYDKNGKLIRKPDGEPIQGYFPPIISETTFYAVQSGLTSRKIKTGPTSHYINLFSGLLRAKDGGNMIIQKKNNITQRCYVSYNATIGVAGAEFVSFPVSAIEAGVVRFLTEVRNFVIDNKSGKTTTALAETEGRITEITDRLNTLKTALITGAKLETLVSAISDLEAQREALRGKAEEQKSEIAKEETAGQTEMFNDIAGISDSNLNELSEEKRYTIRSAIASLVEKIDCNFSHTGGGKSMKYKGELVVNMANGQKFNLTINATLMTTEIIWKDKAKEPAKPTELEAKAIESAAAYLAAVGRK